MSSWGASLFVCVRARGGECRLHSECYSSRSAQLCLPPCPPAPPPPPPCRLLHVDIALALSIEAQLPPSARCRTVAAISSVCKRWRSVVFGEQELWKRLSIRLPHAADMLPTAADDQQSPGGRVNGKLWLLRRVEALLKALDLVAMGDWQPVDRAAFKALLAQAPATLEALSFDRFTILESDALASLSRLSKLQRLSIGCRVLLKWPAAVAQLPLTDLCVRVDAAVPDSLACSLPALAGSLTFLQLRCGMATLEGADTPSLAPLTALQRLQRLEVQGSGVRLTPLMVPAPASFPCLKEYRAVASPLKVRGAAVLWIAVVLAQVG